MEDLQRRSLKLCDQLLGRFVEHTQERVEGTFEGFRTLFRHDGNRCEMM